MLLSLLPLALPASGGDPTGATDLDETKQSLDQGQRTTKKLGTGHQNSRPLPRHTPVLQIHADTAANAATIARRRRIRTPRVSPGPTDASQNSVAVVILGVPLHVVSEDSNAAPMWKRHARQAQL